MFVNNVSLGLYADAVQRAGYREAKIRTLLDTVPDVLGPESQPPHLRWDGPNGNESGAAVLVSNNSYRLGRAVGSRDATTTGSRRLGIAVIGLRDRRGGGRRGAGGIRQWSSPTFEIGSDRPVPAGIDGEATVLDPPLRFRIRAGALQVRIAPGHPGASPSALEPDSPLQTIGTLTKFALGRTVSPSWQRQ